MVGRRQRPRRPLPALSPLPTNGHVCPLSLEREQFFGGLEGIVKDILSVAVVVVTQEFIQIRYLVIIIIIVVVTVMVMVVGEFQPSYGGRGRRVGTSLRSPSWLVLL